MGFCLGLRAYQTVNKELDLIFLSCKKIKNNNFERNCLKEMEF